MGTAGRGGRRVWTRRDFLRRSGTVAVGGAVAGIAGPAWGGRGLGVGLAARADSPPTAGFLTTVERQTLSAAVARIIPAEGPGDWSAADLGVVDYIDNVLSGFDRDPATGAIYPAGPYRLPGGGGDGFYGFTELTRVKLIGWRQQAEAWRAGYRDGLATLNDETGGSFAGVPSAIQDAVLTALDAEGSPFFSMLFDHTMEGAYAHPVYGGNREFKAWQWAGFAGDVHGVRFPTTGSRGAWNLYGGYAPEEMIVPGSDATEQPVITPAPGTRW
ncbi:MAG TPA: gluconate 2-dehydrogenase subunit 3 family protein [Acidimicrobiales bacterium]|nr:gluconate 2-dehydrogenase subunit 3 family protein [Acidimicrobiales bacterium]